MHSLSPVPTIDLTSWWSGDRAARSSLARELDRAARTVGFMQIVRHRIAPSAIAGLTRSLDAFFGLPTHVKERWTAPPHVNRGYRPPCSERLSDSIGVDSPGDVFEAFEAFDIGASAGDHPHLDLDPVAYADNVWPTCVPAFEPGVAGWFREVAALARTLESIFELALGLPDGFFEPYTDHSIDVLRMVHHAAGAGVATGRDRLGMGAHTDDGIVTILWTDPVIGLEVLDGHGEWRPVVPAPGVLVINLGDLLARWTNDQWRSTMHRVVPPADVRGRSLRRRSAAFFHDGNADAVVSTLAPCRDADGRSSYADITVAEHLARKRGGSHGLAHNAHGTREAARIGSSAA